MSSRIALIRYSYTSAISMGGRCTGNALFSPSSTRELLAPTWMVWVSTSSAVPGMTSCAKLAFAQVIVQLAQTVIERPGQGRDRADLGQARDDRLSAMGVFQHRDRARDLAQLFGPSP